MWPAQAGQMRCENPRVSQGFVAFWREGRAGAGEGKPKVSVVY
jgi:hypothetical protein